MARQAEYKEEALKLYKAGDQVGAKKFLAQVRFHFQYLLMTPRLLVYFGNLTSYINSHPTYLHILLQTKGFEQMIEASKRGLPVDMSKIPPSLKSLPEKHVLSRQNTLPHVRR